MKKIWIIVTFVMIAFTSYQIQSTYAKYATEVSGQVQKSIGKWEIVVNGTKITTGIDKQEFQINQLQYNSNNYVQEEKIAPGLTGYFDVEIDATQSSVAVIYDVLLDAESLNISDSIKMVKLVKVVDNIEQQEGIINTGANKYTGTISLDEIKQGKKVTVRVYIGWEDDTTGNNDKADSELGSNKELRVPIPIEVTVSQYKGEEIVEYTGE